MHSQMVTLESQQPSDNTDESAPPIKKQKIVDQELKNPEVPLGEPSFSSSKPSTYASRRLSGP